MYGKLMHTKSQDVQYFFFLNSKAFIKIIQFVRNTGRAFIRGEAFLRGKTVI